ncbi:MAG: hypothetical protein SFZ03_05560 [Candidatus Melainabacteria bacterium]|nr:hypothetical protein [Candidatus Melainabacteria bacterium]
MGEFSVLASVLQFAIVLFVGERQPPPVQHPTRERPHLRPHVERNPAQARTFPQEKRLLPRNGQGCHPGWPPDWRQVFSRFWLFSRCWYWLDAVTQQHRLGLAAAWQAFCGLSLWSVDRRSLTLYRIGLGALILADALSRLPDAGAFYTAQGFLPASVLAQHFANPLHVCLYTFSNTLGLGDTLGWAVFLLCLQAIAGASVSLGWHPGKMLFLGWVLLGSIHARNPLVNHSGDDLLRLLCFWSVLLPWHCGIRNPVARAKNQTLPSSLRSPIFLGLLVQLVLMYWSSVAFKTSAEWQTEGTAVSYALHIGYITGPLGNWLRGLPDVYLKILTHGVFWAEIIAPLLLILPWKPLQHLSFRAVGVALLLLLHAGIATCLTIGLFPWINLVALSLWIPSQWWDLGQTPLTAAKPSAKILTPSPVVFILCLIALTGCLGWNLHTLGYLNRSQPHSLTPQAPLWSIQGLVPLLRLEQFWAVFSPHPTKSNIWLVAGGKTQAGRVVNLMPSNSSQAFSNEPLSWQEPQQLHRAGQDRWWKFYEKLWSHGNNRLIIAQYARYRCQEWNQQHPLAGDRLLWLELYYLEKPTRLAQSTTKRNKARALKRQPLWKQWCEPSNQATSSRSPIVWELLPKTTISNGVSRKISQKTEQSVMRRHDLAQ